MAEAQNNPPMEVEPQGEGAGLPLVVPVFNQKGGVGKTTTAVNVAAMASLLPVQAASGGGKARKRRVLLMDFDPQGHATWHSGLDRSNDDERSPVTAMLLGKGAASSVEALAVATEYYDCLPGGLDVSDAEITLGRKGLSFALLEKIEAITSGRWDLIVIDCPPALNTLTINALNAASSLIIPMFFEYASLVGLSDLGDSIDKAKKHNKRLEVAAVVGVRPELRTLHGKAMQKAAREWNPEAFYEDPIRKCTLLAEALGNRRPITHYAPRSTGATDYRKLTTALAAKGAV